MGPGDVLRGARTARRRCRALLSGADVWRGKVERLRLLEESATAAFKRATEVALETDKTRAEAEKLAADNLSRQMSLQSAQQEAQKAKADATASLTNAKATDKKLKRSLATVNAKRMQMSRKEQVLAEQAREAEEKLELLKTEDFRPLIEQLCENEGVPQAPGSPSPSDVV